MNTFGYTHTVGRIKILQNSQAQLTTHKQRKDNGNRVLNTTLLHTVRSELKEVVSAFKSTGLLQETPVGQTLHFGL